MTINQIGFCHYLPRFSIGELFAESGMLTQTECRQREAGCLIR